MGVLAEVQTLPEVSVADLAESLQAEILCCQESTGKLIENVMIGALSVDNGGDYFNRKENKAVVVRGDRPDVMLAALSTSTVCLIISNGNETSPQVINWAEDKDVPVLSVKQDVLTIVDEIEKAFIKAGSGQQAEPEKSE